MPGEELPPVVAVVDGDDSGLLAMFERDIEAVQVFGADLQAALEEAFGGITVSGAQISGEGIGAAGAVLGEQLASGIEEGAAGLDLRSEMEGATSGAARAGQAAGSEIASGIEEGAAAAGDVVALEIAQALTAGMSAAGAAAGAALDAALDAGTATVGTSLADRINDQLHSGISAGSGAAAGALGQLGAGSVASVAGAGLLAGLPAALGAVGAVAGEALSAALIEGTAGTGEQIAAQVGSGLRGAMPGIGADAAVRLSDALLEGASGVGDAVSEQVGVEMRPQIAAVGERAGATLAEAIVQGSAGAGDAVAADVSAGLGQGLATGAAGESAAVAQIAQAAGDEMQAAGEAAGVRYVAGIQQGMSTAQANWRAGPMFGVEQAEAPDPFVQDPGGSSRTVLQSVLAQEQAAKDAVAQEARSVAEAARAALLDAFGSAEWQISGEQFAQLTDAGVAEWRAEVEAQSAAVGAGFAGDFADALRTQFEGLDWSGLSEAQAAALTDILSASARDAGLAAGSAAGGGVVTGIEAVLASDEAFIRAAMDAGMSQPMIEAVQNLRAGIVDLTASIPGDMLGAFEGIQERFAEEGTAAGTAYALSLQEALNAQAATLRPPTEVGAQPNYVDMTANLEQWQALQGKVSGEAGGTAAEIAKVGTAADGASGAMGGMAGLMGGPLMMGLMGVAGFLPMLSGLFSSTGVSAADFTQTVSQDSNAVGDNTAATIQNTLAKFDLSGLQQQLGLSQAQLIEYAAGEADVQQQVTAAYNAKTEALGKTAGVYYEVGKGAGEINNASQVELNQLNASKAALDAVTAAVAQAIDTNRQNSEELLAAEQSTQIYDASVASLVTNLKLQAEQAHMSADATGAYLMGLVPGTQAYTNAVGDQVTALRQSAIQAGINATALNESLAPQAQLSTEAMDAATAYQQSATAAGAYTNAITALYGQYGQTSGAQAAFTSALGGLNGQIGSGTNAVDLNTAAGAKNFTQFSSVAQAAESYAEKLYQQTRDTNQATNALQDMAGKLDKAATQAGLTKTQVQELNTELFGVPDIKDITVHLNPTPAEQQMSALSGFIHDEIDSINAQPINLFLRDEVASVNSAPPNLTGGGHALRDSGGAVEQGVPYVIGVNRKPEIFVPGASGFITPMDMLAPADAAPGPAGDGGGYAYSGSAYSGPPIVNVYIDGRLVTAGARTETQNYARRNGVTGFAAVGR